MQEQAEPRPLVSGDAAVRRPPPVLGARHHPRVSIDKKRDINRILYERIRFKIK